MGPMTGMSERSLRRTAWLLCAVSLSGAAAQVVLLVAAGVPLPSARAVDEAFPIITIATVVGAAVGAVIVERHPRSRIGWLLCLGHAGAAVGLAAQELALPANASLVPPEVWYVAAWVARLLDADYALALLGALLLIVPDGHLPSWRWWPVAGLLGGGGALTVVSLLLVSPARLAGGANPTQVGGPVTVLATAGMFAIVAGLIGAALALVVRLRRAGGAQRRQLRWICAAAAVLAFALVVLVGDDLLQVPGGTDHWYITALFQAGYLAVPVATGFAVLRYRLYDIDVIIGRTVRFAAIVLFATVGYVAAVVAIGTVLGGGSGSVLPSLLAYVLVALAFQPLRRGVDRLADRVVHGDRAAPYDSLAELSRRLRATAPSDAGLLRLVARSSATGTGARAARVTVSVPGGADVSASWPGDELGEPDLTEPVRHGTDVLGRIELVLVPGLALTRVGRRLLDDLAAQAGLAFRNVQLTAALRGRATALAVQQRELAASRRRLRVAIDAERERVASAIQTEVAIHLAPLPAALAALHDEVMSDPEAARERLAALQESTAWAIDALRTVTAGVLPPLLVRQGLAAAVTDVAARLPGRPTVAVSPAVAGVRFGHSLEAAAYLCCVAAVGGFAPGAGLRLDADGEQLVVTLRGRRVAGMADRQAVYDRVEAVGGQLTEELLPDGGAGLRAVLPLVTTSHAAASGPGPNADLLM
jgi:signal transduction histidine kinase